MRQIGQAFRNAKSKDEKFLGGRGGFFEQLFLAIDHGIDIRCGQLEAVPVSNGIRRAGLHAVAAKNAARIINVVDAGVAFAR